MGIALVLLTPLILSRETAYPFIVGKAIWSRSLIGVVFALWVPLALWRPAWRPPRSRLLWLLGASLAVALLAAVFGVSPTRSLWSTYERMQGVIDLTHWFAFTVVVASVTHGRREIRSFLSVQVVVGSVVAAIAVGNLYAVEWPLLGSIPEQHYPRIAATLGNADFLGAYLMVNLLLALGLAWQSFFPNAPPRDPPDAVTPPGAPEESARRWWSRRLAGAAPWIFAAMSSLFGMTLSGSLSTIVGLAGGVAFGLAGVLRQRSGRWRILLATAGAAGLFALLLTAPTPWGKAFSNPLTSRLDRLYENVLVSMGPRSASWDAGIRGFGDRPLLGFGPENYLIPFGRHASGLGAAMQVHDQAHNTLVEEAVTKGAPGLLLYLGIWGYALLIPWRAALSPDRQVRALALFAGAALTSFFVASQALFVTASHSVQFAVLSAVVVHLEPASGALPRLPQRLAAALSALFRRGWVRVAAAVGGIGLAGAGLGVNYAIHSGASAIHRGLATSQLVPFETATRRFDPLANLPRRLLFENLQRNWSELHRSRSSEAQRLLAWSETEARAALAAEPRNWQIHASLARLYGAVASTDARYAERALHHLEAALELAPNRDPWAPG